MKIEGKLTLDMVDFWVWVNKVLAKQMAGNEIIRETIENGHVDAVKIENGELALLRDHHENINIPAEHFWEWVNSQHKLPYTLIYSHAEFWCGVGSINIDFKSEQ